MFNLDNIDLDFDDDDFSSNIFSKGVGPATGGTLQGNTLCEERKPSWTASPNQVFSSGSSPDSRTRSGDLFSFPVTTNAPKEKRLKRPHVQDEKQQKKRLSHEGLLQRRFPGPAGLLPDKPFKQISDFPLPAEKPSSQEEDGSDKEKPIIYSQCSGSVFLQSGYQKLVTDFNLNEANNPLNRYTVEWVKKTAFNKGLQGRKIPFLGLVVHAANNGMPDPVLMLRDPTGEICGSLHREVWAEMGGKLRAGIALALRQVPPALLPPDYRAGHVTDNLFQVGVLITGVIRRQIYLNITMNNILAIYSSPSESEREVEITTVNKASKSELLKNLGPSSPFTSVSEWSRCSGGKLKDRREQNVVVGGGAEVLSDLGIVLDDADFAEEMKVPEGDGEGGEGASSQGLSGADSFMFDQVLSGIDFEEFGM